MNKIDSRKKTLKQWPTWKKTLTAVGLIVVVIGLAFILLDWQSRSSYAKYDKEAERIISQTEKADGAAKVQALAGAYGVDNPYYSRGNGLTNTWRYCGVDVNCPESDKGVIVLMPRGKENAFLSSLLESSGYKQGDIVKCYQNNEKSSTTCFCGRTNSQYNVKVTVEPADPYHHGAPVQDDGTSAEVWRYVTISVSPRF